MAKKIKLVVVKIINDDESNAKEVWTSRITDENYIKKICNLSNECSREEWLAVINQDF